MLKLIICAAKTKAASTPMSGTRRSSREVFRRLEE